VANVLKNPAVRALSVRREGLSSSKTFFIIDANHEAESKNNSGRSDLASDKSTSRPAPRGDPLLDFDQPKEVGNAYHSRK
jgi:hypothetical protein